MDANAPVYQKTTEGRVQVKKIPFHRPTMRQTFQDKDGNGKTIRFKMGSRTINQLEQIEKEKIAANERFTTAERRAIEFRNGVLTTNNTIAQQYLEAHPEFEGFDGSCEEITVRKYKLLDTGAEEKIKNTDTRKRIKAASKVIDLNLEEAQEMLIRLNGSFFVTPNELEECQNMLIAFIDDAEEPGLDAVLATQDEVNIDDKTTVLIGKLLNAKLLSFDSVEGKISKKDKSGKWITIRDMSSEYSLDERMRMFSDFLNSDDGKALKADLEKEVKKIKNE